MEFAVMGTRLRARAAITVVIISLVKQNNYGQIYSILPTREPTNAWWYLATVQSVCNTDNADTTSNMYPLNSSECWTWFSNTWRFEVGSRPTAKTDSRRDEKLTVCKAELLSSESSSLLSWNELQNSLQFDVNVPFFGEYCSTTVADTDLR